MTLSSPLSPPAGVALAAGEKASAAPAAQPDPRRASPRRYDMKKSINLWAFPYPQRMTLKECLQLAKDAGFDGIELNYDLENDLSPKSGTKEYQAIRKMAADIGIAISGLCSFLFWPYSLTSNKPAERARGLELAGQMMQAAHELGTENLLVVPGAVDIPWIKDHEPVAADVCDRRAREAVAKLAPQAEKLGVYLNIENIFFNGYLLSPQDMNAFVDSFHSKHVRVHFDTGNIMLFQFPEDWIAAPRPAHQEHPPEGVHQEGHRPLAGIVPPAARRHHQLAGGDWRRSTRSATGIISRSSISTRSRTIRRR